MHWDALECGYFRGPIRASCSHCYPFVAVTRDVLLSPGMYMTYSAHQVCRAKNTYKPASYIWWLYKYIYIYVKPVQPKDFTWSLCFTPLGGETPKRFSVRPKEWSDSWQLLCGTIGPTTSKQTTNDVDLLGLPLHFVGPGEGSGTGESR